MQKRRPRILWGLTGSVATIRAPALADALLSFAEVQAVVTHRAKHFLGELPSDVRVHDDDGEWVRWQGIGDPVLHIELRKWADALVIAPATADCLAKLTYGLCDNLLLSIARAWDFAKPFVVAPAMNTKMWEHPVTAGQLGMLASWGIQMVSPVSKKLACADVGMGGLAPIDEIARAVAAVAKPLDG